MSRRPGNAAPAPWHREFWRDAREGFRCGFFFGYVAGGLMLVVSVVVIGKLIDG